MNTLWKKKNFTILFFGRMITNMGDSLYYVAAMWLVYQLSKDPLYSGIAGFLMLLPMSLQFVAGPLVDRWSIKRTLVATQIFQLILISLIPISYGFGFLNVPLLLIIIPLAAFIEQFAYPSETKALPMILNKEELVKGNSWFSFAYKGIDMAFNALGGWLVATIGAMALFVTDAVTFAITACLFGLLSLPVGHKRSKEIKTGARTSIKDYFADLSEGFSIVFHSLLAAFLLGSIICNFALGASTAVLPSFSNQRGGADIYGLYLASESIGVLLGSFLSSWAGKFRVGYFTIVSFIIGAGCWLLAALVPWTVPSIAFFGLAWIPIGASNVLLGAVKQSVVPIHLLARVSSVTYSMSAVAMPIGSLLGGYYASTFGSPIVFALAGSGFLVIAIVWWSHSKLRQLPPSTAMTPSTFHLDVAENE
ncbi:MFS transporter [Caenibacillus caldisaponilyticus]|uniref:MFS transporter n=1 Tax=Caenibacillus caldisaponilyticus TaxID=1674942 RepID=UPI00098879EC|nr:MFS transporter [Caenibacillus caldisaponilyticus]